MKIEIIEAKFDYEGYIKKVIENVNTLKHNTFVHWQPGNKLSGQPLEDVINTVKSNFDKYDPAVKFTDYLIFIPVRTSEKETNDNFSRYTR